LQLFLHTTAHSQVQLLLLFEKINFILDYVEKANTFFSTNYLRFHDMSYSAADTNYPSSNQTLLLYLQNFRGLGAESAASLGTPKSAPSPGCKDGTLQIGATGTPRRRPAGGQHVKSIP
jgi:hypothetical protein